MTAFAVALLGVLVFAVPAQAKFVVGGFNGGTGGIDVNNSGNGAARGTIYIADPSNARVQRFSPSGGFELAWGWDVVTTGRPDDRGTSAFEICRVAADCKAGKTSPTTANNGLLSSPQSVAVNQTSGHVYVTEAGNNRISEFDPDGNFIRTWGWDVDGTVAGAGFEICPAANSCKQGVAGPGAGQFGNISSANRLSTLKVDSSDNVWVPDPVNNRIQQFDSSGNFIKMVGGDVISDGAEGTGTLTSGSATVDPIATTSKFFEVGQTVTSSGGSIPAGTTIVSCTPAANSTGTCLAPTRLVLSQRATAGGVETITAAPGAGNVAVNEQQAITLPAGVTSGAFNLSFAGESTGAFGTGDVAGGQRAITNLSVTRGAFAVGQSIRDTANFLFPGTTITGVDIGNNTLAISPGGVLNKNGASLVGFEVPFDASAATIQARLEGLPNINPGDVSVTGDDGGPWTVAFQGSRYGGADVPAIDVDTRGLFPDSPSARVASANPGSLEVCSVPADCRAGASGVAFGQFASFAAPDDLAFDSSGNLYALDAANNRVQKLDPALTSAVDFGTATFAGIATGSPTNVIATNGGTRLLFNIDAAGGRQLVELDTADASLKDTSLAGAGLTNIGGIAADTTTGAFYATTSSNASPVRVITLNSAPLTAPVATIDPVTVKGSTTATFSGTVDPKGGVGVNCNYQYSTDQVSWIDVAEPDCDSLVLAGGAQAVSQDVTGLVPNSKYFVRLKVTRKLDPAATVFSAGVSVFSTDSIPPDVSNVGAVQIADTSARLVGTINPNNSATGYVFQYGTTPALGSQTPPIDIGAGTVPQVVSQLVTGLRPSTTYYFRLVATNAFDSIASVTRTLLTRSGPPPSGGIRSYEQVSPVDKNGGGALSGLPRATVGYNGEAISHCSTSLYGDPPGEQVFSCAPYLTRRTSAGWETRGLLPPLCRIDPAGSSFGNLLVEAPVRISKNAEAAVVGVPEGPNCAVPPLDPDSPLLGGDPYPSKQRNLFLTDPFTSPPSFELLTPKADTGFFASHSTGPPLRGASADFRHLVYFHNQPQSPESVGTANKVFDWHDNTIDLVSKNTSNLPITSASVIPDVHNNVSEPGDRIFFENPTTASAKELYMRENASVTHWVSEQECDPACSNGVSGDNMRAATPAGDKVAFITGARLVNDDPTSASCTDSFGTWTGTACDLYLYRHSADPATDPQNLALLSKDNQPADGTSSLIRGVVGMSDDGNTVYFAADGQIVAGEDAVPGVKLYRWRWNGGSPTVDFLLGGLSASEDSDAWDPSSQAQANQNDRHVTPSGANLLITTVVPVDPVADQDSDDDLYRWSQADGWLCVSCQGPGLVSKGDAATTISGSQTLITETLAPRIQMTDDGQHIFFTSSDALVPEDTNSQGSCPSVNSGVGPVCQDVYEWNDGVVSLISSGISDTPAYLIGISHDGEDVFFYTEERLVGWDTDTAGDIYDARVGGGFPEPPAVGAPCEGDACRGAATTPPAGSGAGSRVFAGPGNRKGASSNACSRISKKAQRKLRIAKRSAKKGQAKRARALRRQARNLNRRAKRCNRRQGR